MQFSRCLAPTPFRWLSCEVPPVPIPNTEVKLTYTDNTWLATAREDRQPPGPQRVTPSSGSFLLSHNKRKLSSFSFLNFIQLCAFLFRAPFFFCYGQNIVETSLRLVSHCFARASPRFICHRQRSAPHSPKRKRNKKPSYPFPQDYTRILSMIVTFSKACCPYSRNPRDSRRRSLGMLKGKWPQCRYGASAACRRIMDSKASRIYPCR